jgi:hypothetical protein
VSGGGWIGDMGESRLEDSFGDLQRKPMSIFQTELMQDQCCSLIWIKTDCFYFVIARQQREF